MSEQYLPCMAQRKSAQTTEEIKRKKDFQRTLAKANSGDVEAMAITGYNYCVGVGTVADMETGMKWIQKSINNGNGQACRYAFYVYQDRKDYDKCIEFLRIGASMNDNICLLKLFDCYDRGEMGIKQNEKLAAQTLKKCIINKIPDLFHNIALAYKYGLYSEIKQDKSAAIFWFKKHVDAEYSDYLKYLKNGNNRACESSKSIINRIIKEELDGDYDPALHVDEYQAWLKDKPSNTVGAVAHTPTNTQGSASKPNNNKATFHYTKSGRGQSQNTGQWTDGMASEECEVEFGDAGISVNGAYHAFIRRAGKWNVYGGYSMGFGGNSTTFYYYVDDNKNMQQVCESSSPYGYDTFIYPMSRNGDPTPRHVNNPGMNDNGYNSVNAGGSSGTSRRSSHTYDNGGYEDCHVCHGSGRCQTCNGTGYVTNYGKTSECPNCLIEAGRRTGKCSVCRGRGKIFK